MTLVVLRRQRGQVVVKPPEQERAIQEVFESIKVIDTSLRCYYEGEQHMYRAMAAQLRILFCDTRREKDNSLLARAFSTFELARMCPIAWLEPGSPEQPNPHLRRLRGAIVPVGCQARFSKMPFVVIEYGNGLVVADIELEDEGPLLSVDQWSAQTLTTHPTRVSIRDVIRLVADKGGGAHVDLGSAPKLTQMQDARPAGVGEHILFTVAISRLAVNLGVYLTQRRELDGLDGHLKGFLLDPTHESAKRMARVPDRIKASGAYEYHLCSVLLLHEPAPS